jgi:Flp pilus assembly protein TadD
MRARAPGDVDGIARSADVLVRHGLAREAIALADEWSNARPGDVHGLLLRAWVQSEAGQPDSAIAWTARVVALEPDSTGPRRLLARYLRDAHRWHDAIVEIERLRQDEPQDASLLLDLGFCRDKMGDVPAAIEAGREALALAPDQPAVLNYLGYLLADHERDLPEAERLVSRAVEQDPDNGAFVDSMGWVLFRLGRFTQAREQLERALRLSGGDPVIHEHLGDVYHQLKLDELARQQYRLSLAGDGGNGRVKSKLEAAH